MDIPCVRETRFVVYATCLVPETLLSFLCVLLEGLRVFHRVAENLLVDPGAPQFRSIRIVQQRGAVEEHSGARGDESFITQILESPKTMA